MREILEELFRYSYQDVWRYLFSLCRDPALAEELAAETFLEAVTSIGSFRKDSDIKTWLFSIARHRWFAYLRKKGRTPPVEELTDRILAPGKTPEEAWLRKELEDRVEALLSKEPERTAAVLKLRAEGCSFREIADKFGITENSARIIDFRARTKLRRILTEEGYCYE